MCRTFVCESLTNSNVWLRRAIAAICVVTTTSVSGADDDLARVAVERYNETCAVCHDRGVDGAPRPREADDWAERLEYGIEELYLNTYDGVGSRMPPRGLCYDCSDAELDAIVDYMLGDLAHDTAQTE